MTAFVVALLGAALIAPLVYQYRHRASAGIENRREGPSIFDQELLLRRSLPRNTRTPRRDDTIYL